MEIAEWYQEEAWNQLNGKRKADIDAAIARLKSEGRETEIQSRIEEIKAQIVVDMPKELAYVAGDLLDDYINDMKITQLFADTNRKAMMQIILNGLGIENNSDYETFTTVHNYIAFCEGADTDSMILRKGAVSASIHNGTLDESPMAYKNMDDIMQNIVPTAKIVNLVKPVYNFKAAE